MELSSWLTGASAVDDMEEGEEEVKEDEDELDENSDATTIGTTELGME